jgi:transketolase
MSDPKNLRQQFADTMLDVGSRDKDVVVMVGDISHGILQPFAKANPDRYYNIGICEPTIVNMAAGLSKVGLTPVLHTIAPFLIERSYEQIKLDFGYQNLAVNLISVGGSFDYSQLGCSHHCYSDVSLISHFAKANIVMPGSAIEFDQLFKTIYKKNAINYFRLPDTPHGVDIPANDIELGKGIRIREGCDITLVTIGYHLKTAMAAADTLSAKGIDVEVLYYPTIKPFDSELVYNSVLKTGKVLCAEELSAHDGLFNQVMRACSAINDVSLHQIAVTDFIHGYGSFDYLCEKVGLTHENLVLQAEKLVG